MVAPTIDRVRVDILPGAIKADREVGFRVVQAIEQVIGPDLFIYKSVDRTTNQVVIEVTAVARKKYDATEHLLAVLAKKAQALGVSVADLISDIGGDD